MAQVQSCMANTKQRVIVECGADLHDRFKQAAADKHMALATWIRMVSDEAAKKQLRKDGE